MQIVHHILFESAARWGNQTALTGSKRTLSYQELLRRVNSLAAVFIVEGLQKGDRILILLRDPFDAITAALATARAGGIAVPLPCLPEGAELIKLLDETVPSAIVTSGRDVATSQRLEGIRECPLYYFDDLMPSRLPGLVGRVEINPDQRPDPGDPMTKLMGIADSDTAMLLHPVEPSDGDSLVVLTHRQLVRSVQRAIRTLVPGDEQREYLGIPWHTPPGMTRLLTRLVCGHSVYLPQSRLSAAEALRESCNAGCSAFSVSGTDAASFISSQRKTGLKPVEPPATIYLHLSPRCFGGKTDRVVSLPGVELRVVTDFPLVSFFSVLDPARETEHGNSAGIPLVLAEIQNEHGDTVPAGTEGEIVIGSEFSAPGFWEGVFHRSHGGNGSLWKHTGEAGRIDADGYLCLLGPVDEIIRVAGRRFSCRAIEQVISELLPGVDLCVVGIADPLGMVGDIPVLCYVPGNGTSISLSELSVLLADRLDRSQIPRLVFRLDRLPKGPGGVERAALKQSIISTIIESTSQEIR
jgi:acyl-CoA synthetase (AMP-forming)/AMP-acid ligase II